MTAIPLIRFLYVTVNNIFNILKRITRGQNYTSTDDIQPHAIPMNFFAIFMAKSTLRIDQMTDMFHSFRYRLKDNYWDTIFLSFAINQIQRKTLVKNTF